MRYLILLCFSVFVFGASYDFTEYKYISSADVEFKKTGHIEFLNSKTIITYKNPFKKIVATKDDVSITTTSGKTIHLKGKPLFYTKMTINIMGKLDEAKKLKSNKDFDVKKTKDGFEIWFKNSFKDIATKAKVILQNNKVHSFKLFMKNDDTLEIVKQR